MSLPTQGAKEHISPRARLLFSMAWWWVVLQPGALLALAVFG
jgi:hypothetical protein